jgi:hypothetical protein
MAEERKAGFPSFALISEMSDEVHALTVAGERLRRELRIKWSNILIAEVT